MVNIMLINSRTINDKNDIMGFNYKKTKPECDSSDCSIRVSVLPLCYWSIFYIVSCIRCNCELSTTS